MSFRSATDRGSIKFQVDATDSAADGPENEKLVPSFHESSKWLARKAQYRNVSSCPVSE